MFEADFYCENEDCIHLIEFSCEWEAAGQDTKHEIVCPECGARHQFTIDYEPVIANIEVRV